MRRGPRFWLVSLVVVSMYLGGCELVVDFDRSLLVDAGEDGGIGDASFEGDAGVDDDAGSEEAAMTERD